MASPRAAAFIVVVVYPRTKTSTFDLNYYLSKHVPLTKEIWGHYGLRFHSTSELDADSGYHISCVLEWDSKEGFDKAQKDPRSGEIHQDIESGRFTDSTPVFLAGKNVG